MPDTHQRLLLGDARYLPELADRSVHLVVTSPPYWQLKDYGADRQLGYHDTYEAYINDLNLVWQECIRVLHPGCRLCINIGDQFARAAYYGRYKVIPIRTEIIRFCESAGCDYMGAVIWQKVTTCNPSGGASIMGSFPYPRNGILKLDYEFILLFKKPGKAPAPTAEQKAAAALTTEEWNDYFAGHWRFPGERGAEHLAPFPLELPHRLIRMFSFPGETVLDPFAGSGTTLVAAHRLGRHGIGCEIDPDCLPVIRQRLGFPAAGDLTLAPVDTPDFTVDHLPERDLDVRRQQLPSPFRDPLRVERQADPRQQSYGSRIHREQEATDALPRVAAILAPDRVKLSDGRTIRLLGVQPLAARTEAAIAYLNEHALGQAVFIDADGQPADADGVQPAYVHLRNRTHLNAHLLKQGLATADETGQYRHRRRFVNCARRAGQAAD